MQEDNQSPQESDAQWQYSDEVSQNKESAAAQEVAWTASEYISHEKGTGWYAWLGGAVSLIAILVYFFTRDVLSTIVMVIIGIAFGAFAARKPNELQYVVNSQGVSIGPRQFIFDEFKSFSVVDEGPIRSIVLSPLKRFTLPISIYYAPDDEQKITDTLSLYLPYEDKQHDLVDQAMKKIRF